MGWCGCCRLGSFREKVVCGFGGEEKYGCEEMLAAMEQKGRVSDERGKPASSVRPFFRVVELVEEDNHIGV
jgi:hypothetical protein